MALTDLQWVRLLLEDEPSEEVEALTGDGQSREFFVNNPPILAGTLRVTLNGNPQATPAQYTQPDSRTVVFGVAPADGAAVVLLYNRQVFTDAELTHYLAQAALDWDEQLGRVYRAATLALDSLLMGTATSLRFGAGAEEHDLPSVFDRVSRLRAQLAVALSAEAARPKTFEPADPLLPP